MPRHNFGQSLRACPAHTLAYRPSPSLSSLARSHAPFNSPSLSLVFSLWPHNRRQPHNRTPPHSAARPLPPLPAGVTSTCARARSTSPFAPASSPTAPRSHRRTATSPAPARPARSKVLPLGRAPARLLRLRRVRLAAPGSSACPVRGPAFLHRLGCSSGSRPSSPIFTPRLAPNTHDAGTHA